MENSEIQTKKPRAPRSQVINWTKGYPKQLLDLAIELSLDNPSKTPIKTPKIAKQLINLPVFYQSMLALNISQQVLHDRLCVQLNKFHREARAQIDGNDVSNNMMENNCEDEKIESLNDSHQNSPNCQHQNDNFVQNVNLTHKNLNIHDNKLHSPVFDGFQSPQPMWDNFHPTNHKKNTNFNNTTNVSANFTHPITINTSPQRQNHQFPNQNMTPPRCIPDGNHHSLYNHNDPSRLNTTHGSNIHNNTNIINQDHNSTNTTVNPLQFTSNNQYITAPSNVPKEELHVKYNNTTVIAAPSASTSPSLHPSSQSQTLYSSYHSSQSSSELDGKILLPYHGVVDGKVSKINKINKFDSFSPKQHIDNQKNQLSQQEYKLPQSEPSKTATLLPLQHKTQQQLQQQQQRQHSQNQFQNESQLHNQLQLQPQHQPHSRILSLPRQYPNSTPFLPYVYTQNDDLNGLYTHPFALGKTEMHHNQHNRKNYGPDMYKRTSTLQFSHRNATGNDGVKQQLQKEQQNNDGMKLQLQKEQHRQQNNGGKQQLEQQQHSQGQKKLVLPQTKASNVQENVPFFASSGAVVDVHSDNNVVSMISDDVENKINNTNNIRNNSLDIAHDNNNNITNNIRNNSHTNASSSSPKSSIPSISPNTTPLVPTMNNQSQIGLISDLILPPNSPRLLLSPKQHKSLQLQLLKLTSNSLPHTINSNNYHCNDNNQLCFDNQGDGMDNNNNNNNSNNNPNTHPHNNSNNNNTNTHPHNTTIISSSHLNHNNLSTSDIINSNNTIIRSPYGNNVTTEVNMSNNSRSPYGNNVTTEVNMAKKNALKFKPVHKSSSNTTTTPLNSLNSSQNPRQLPLNQAVSAISNQNTSISPYNSVISPYNLSKITQYNPSHSVSLTSRPRRKVTNTVDQFTTELAKAAKQKRRGSSANGGKGKKRGPKKGLKVTKAQLAKIEREKIRAEKLAAKEAAYIAKMNAKMNAKKNKENKNKMSGGKKGVNGAVGVVDHAYGSFDVGFVGGGNDGVGGGNMVRFNDNTNTNVNTSGFQANINQNNNDNNNVINNKINNNTKITNNNNNNNIKKTNHYNSPLVLDLTNSPVIDNIHNPNHVKVSYTTTSTKPKQNKATLPSKQHGRRLKIGVKTLEALRMMEGMIDNDDYDGEMVDLIKNGDGVDCEMVENKQLLTFNNNDNNNNTNTNNHTSEPSTMILSISRDYNGSNHRQVRVKDMVNGVQSNQQDKKNITSDKNIDNDNNIYTTTTTTTNNINKTNNSSNHITALNNNNNYHHQLQSSNHSSSVISTTSSSSSSSSSASFPIRSARFDPHHSEKTTKIIKITTPTSSTSPSLMQSSSSSSSMPFKPSHPSSSHQQSHKYSNVSSYNPNYHATRLVYSLSSHNNNNNNNDNTNNNVTDDNNFMFFGNKKYNNNNTMIPEVIICDDIDNGYQPIHKLSPSDSSMISTHPSSPSSLSSSCSLLLSSSSSSSLPHSNPPQKTTSSLQIPTHAMVINRNNNINPKNDNNTTQTLSNNTKQTTLSLQNHPKARQNITQSTTYIDTFSNNIIPTDVIKSNIMQAVDELHDVEVKLRSQLKKYIKNRKTHAETEAHFASVCNDIINYSLSQQYNNQNHGDYIDHDECNAYNNDNVDEFSHNHNNKTNNDNFPSYFDQYDPYNFDNVYMDNNTIGLNSIPTTNIVKIDRKALVLYPALNPSPPTTKRKQPTPTITSNNELWFDEDDYFSLVGTKENNNNNSNKKFKPNNHNNNNNNNIYNDISNSDNTNQMYGCNNPSILNLNHSNVNKFAQNNNRNHHSRTRRRSGSSSFNRSNVLNEEFYCIDDCTSED